MQADDILDAPVADQTLIYSKFWHRAIAAGIDIVVTTAFSVLVVLVFHTMDPLIVNGVGLVFAFFYFIVTVTLFGASPGKMIMGMRIVKVDGTSATWSSAFLRYSIAFAISFYVLIPHLLVYIFPAIQPAEWVEYEITSLDRKINISTTAHSVWDLICIIVILSNKERRAPYDYIAGTVVIRKRRNGMPSHVIS